MITFYWVAFERFTGRLNIYNLPLNFLPRVNLRDVITLLSTAGDLRFDHAVSASAVDVISFHTAVLLRVYSVFFSAAVQISLNNWRNNVDWGKFILLLSIQPLGPGVMTSIKSIMGSPIGVHIEKQLGPPQKHTELRKSRAGNGARCRNFLYFK